MKAWPTLGGFSCQASSRGSALLLAMLTLGFVAAWSVYALNQQWRVVSVEAAEREGQQAQWLLVGALDWARLVLREDARSSRMDHEGEPWATPLREARLSGFLAASAEGVLTRNDAWVEQLFFSGRLIDLQSRLNVTNLLGDKDIDPTARRAFARLYQTLQLPEAELAHWTQRLWEAHHAKADAQATLPPQRLSQLTWLGLSRKSLNKLMPYITLLPERTQVNLNTASVEVLSACVEGLTLANAKAWVQARDQQPFENIDSIQHRMGAAAQSVTDPWHSVQTRYFLATGTLRDQDREWVVQAVMQREGMRVKTLWLDVSLSDTTQSCIRDQGASC